MPIESPAQSASAVILDGGGITAESGGARYVPLLRLTDAVAYHYAVSLGEMHLLPGGEIVPDLLPISHLEGLGGAAGTGAPGMALESARAKGRKILPHAFPCVAWGQPRDGYLTRSPAGRDREGREIWCYHDVWRRPVHLGVRFLRWEFDAAGWADFRRRALAWLLRESSLIEVPEIYRDIIEQRIRAEIAHIEGHAEAHIVARRDDLRSRLVRPPTPDPSLPPAPRPRRASTAEG